MNKSLLGLILVCIGVGVAAVFGARNTSAVNDSLVPQGQASVAGKAATDAKTAYCQRVRLYLGIEWLGPVLDAETHKALTAIAIQDGCRPPEKSEPDSPDDTEASEDAEATDDVDKSEDTPTYDDVLAQLTAAHNAQAKSPKLPDEVLAALRKAWIDTAATTLEPSARAATTPRIKPGSRLADWLAGSALPFAVGLFLIVAGGLMSRKAIKEAATSDDSKQPGNTGPVDFGKLLNSLSTAVAGLHSRASQTSDPAQGDYESLQTAIEALQYDMLEPLIESRIKVQARFGMAGFADIFGPLSGGERNLNRAWSALVDLHWGEATAALHLSHQQLASAVESLQRQMAANGP